MIIPLGGVDTGPKCPSDCLPTVLLDRGWGWGWGLKQKGRPRVVLSGFMENSREMLLTGYCQNGVVCRRTQMHYKFKNS